MKVCNVDENEVVVDAGRARLVFMTKFNRWELFIGKYMFGN